LYRALLDLKGNGKKKGRNYEKQEKKTGKGAESYRPG